MTKRINFSFNKLTGKFTVNCGPEFEVKETEEFIELSTTNWYIKLDLIYRKIFIHSYSNAKKKRRDFNIYARSGSLFLYNSTTNWYWYWRNKNLQDELDRFSIEKIVTIEELPIEHEIVCKVNQETGEPIPVELSESDGGTIRLFPADVPVKIIPKYYAKTVNSNLDFVISQGEITPSKFVIIEYKLGHRILLIKPDIKINDLIQDHSLSDVKLEYPNLQRGDLIEFIKRNRERLCDSGN